jgi:hypothetical protein
MLGAPQPFSAIRCSSYPYAFNVGERLSEKPRRCLQRSLVGRQSGAFRSISPCVSQSNLRSERRSHPFRTVSEGEFCELPLYSVLRSSYSPSPVPMSLSDAFPHTERIILRLVTDIETNYLPI